MAHSDVYLGGPCDPGDWFTVGARSLGVKHLMVLFRQGAEDED